MAQAKAPARSLCVARLGIVQGSDQGGGWDHDLICDLVGEMRRLGSHGVDGVHIVGVCFVLAVSLCPLQSSQLRLPPLSQHGAPP